MYINKRKRLLTGTVPVNNFLLTGTVPVNNSLLTGTLDKYLLFYFYIEFGLFAKNKWLLVAFVFRFEPSKSYILTTLTSLQLGLNCIHKSCSDQEAVLSAHITMRNSPLFWSFPVTITSNLNLSLYKYGCTEHLPYSNQDLGVYSPCAAIAERLQLYTSFYPKSVKVTPG